MIITSAITKPRPKTMGQAVSQSARVSGQVPAEASVLRPSGQQNKSMERECAASIGTCLDHFSVIKQLGRGSNGVVFLVVSKLNGNEYVIKKIRMKNVDARKQKSLLNEVLILRKVKHPNVIRYFTSFIEDNYLNIVMEYASKGDLHHLTRKYKEQGKNIPEKTIWAYAWQLVQAISYLHSSNIIHRDIKTLNIFLSDDDTIKLGDLGVSTMYNSSMVLQGTKVGTPLFLAPELIKQQPYDYRVDIWALGCVMYYLARLEPPFQGENFMALGYQIVHKYPKPITNDLYSPRLAEVINKFLEKNPSSRPSFCHIIDMFPSHFKTQRPKTTVKKQVKTVEKLPLDPPLTNYSKEEKVIGPMNEKMMSLDFSNQTSVHNNMDMTTNCIDTLGGINNGENLEHEKEQKEEFLLRVSGKSEPKHFGRIEESQNEGNAISKAQGVMPSTGQREEIKSQKFSALVQLKFQKSQTIGVTMPPSRPVSVQQNSRGSVTNQIFPLQFKSRLVSAGRPFAFSGDANKPQTSEPPVDKKEVEEDQKYSKKWFNPAPKTSTDNGGFKNFSGLKASTFMGQENQLMSFEPNQTKNPNYDDPFAAFEKKEKNDQNSSLQSNGTERKFSSTENAFFRKSAQKGTCEDFRSMLKVHRSKNLGDPAFPQAIRSGMVKPPSAYSTSRSFFPQSQIRSPFPPASSQNQRTQFNNF